MKLSFLFLAVILLCAPSMIFGKVDWLKAKEKEALFNILAAQGGIASGPEEDIPTGKGKSKQKSSTPQPT